MQAAPRVSANRSAFGSRVAAPRSHARAVRCSAMATLTTYVKGDPKTNTLGDCPFCHRVMLTLEAKGVHYDTAYVDFSDKPQWLVDKFEGKVPVIKQGDFEMNDSDKIVAWLEEQHPQPAMTSTPPEATLKLLPAFRGWLLAKPEEEADKKAGYLSALDAVEAALAGAPGPLFGGAAMNSTDAAFAPKLYHSLVALKHWKGFDLYAGDSYPKTKAYWLALAELPAWKKVDYGKDAIIKGWGTHVAAAQ